MPELPRTCVIGAGVSGLTAGKALSDWGIPYTCFESSDDVGGNWYFRNPNGRSSAYRSLHIDTSKPSISFKDFPMPDHFPDYPHHTEIAAWLRDYADAFGLRERIRFHTTVQRAERLKGAGYSDVTTEVEAAGPWYYAEDYHQQYLAKNPAGYCGIGGTGVSCPTGLVS